LVTGAFHQMISAIENQAPDAVMEQAIREADEATEEARSELAQVLTRQHLASSRIARDTDALRALDAQVQLALKEKREDLAREAVARQLDLEAQLSVVQEAADHEAHARADLERMILALDAQRREMREELAAFRAQQDRAVPGVDAPPMGGVTGTVAEQRARRAKEVFGDVMSRQTNLPRPLGSTSKLQELADLERTHRIDERLAAAKAQQG